MSDQSTRKTYYRAAFAGMAGTLTENKPLLETALAALALSVPVNEVRLALGGGAVVVEWQSLPLAADIVLVDAAVAAFVGGTTTSAPFQYNSFAVATSTSATPVVKINETTPPLDAGTYQVIWTSSLRMQAVIANTGVEAKIRLTRSDGAFVEQTDAWDRNVNHAYNGALTFQVLAGQTLTTLLTFVRLGASGTAEMSGSRITVDKIG